MHGCYSVKISYSMKVTVFKTDSLHAISFLCSFLETVLAIRKTSKTQEQLAKRNCSNACVVAGVKVAGTVSEPV